VSGVSDDDHGVSVGSEALDVLALALDAPSLPNGFGEQIRQLLIPYESGHSSRS
jgi:hypothetical protein